MAKPSGNDCIESLFPCMAEGGMTEIMAQRDRLGEIIVQAKSLGYGTSDLSNLKGMGQPGPVMVARGGKKNLGLML
jgi:hypothetical protein